MYIENYLQNMKKLFYSILLLFFSSIVVGQCPNGQNLISIVLTTDNYPGETSWNLKDQAGNTILSNPALTGATTTTTTICVNSNACLLFTINDSYGDGICCGYGQGSYSLQVNGVTVASGGSFTTVESTYLNCGPGQSCTSAIPVDTGTYVSPANSTWYSFTPDQNGMYEITTCLPFNFCNTKIWVYDQCTGIVVAQNNYGTIFYDDNNGNCAQYAALTAALDSTITYIIRIGGDSTCNNANVHWAINYLGPILGCTDTSACNYNPMASQDDGSCLYYPSPLCPNPDLIIIESQVRSSMYLDQVNANNDPCAVTEGCLNGYGTRTVIRFDTYIKNIGLADYYIGNPSANPSQFNLTNCHGHNHYEGYAEYRLYQQNGQMLPIGMKNGFCVLDFDGCPDGGTPKFSCGNMGISAGCGDIYHAPLQCQWIDITDVDTGDYILAVKVNWDQSPDALGRQELTYVNNWAQACIKIFYNANGQKTYQQLTNCSPYLDCTGTQFGNAVIDCNGVCNGGTKMGDLDNNGAQQINDGQLYVSGIVNNTINPSNCNDLNGDNQLTVWDAALITECDNHGTNVNGKCFFTRGLSNPNQNVTLSIGAINTTLGYVDVYIYNPNNTVLAYEFDMSGLVISNVQSLIPSNDYPSTPSFNVGGNKIISISYIDSTISKFTAPTPLCRVYYSSLTGNSICISNIVHIINNNYEAVNTSLNNACLNVSGINGEYKSIESKFSIYPNPVKENLFIKNNSWTEIDADVEIVDVLGKLIRKEKIKVSFDKDAKINIDTFETGVYFLKIKFQDQEQMEKFIIK